MLTINKKIQIPLREIDFSFSRSGGPGGQHVNKVNTKALLRWSIKNSRALPDDVKARFLARYPRRITSEGEILITSQRFRDQGRNVADCLSKLREMILAIADAPIKRKVTKPSKASKKRQREAKERNAKKKQLRRAPRHDDS